MKRRWFSVLAGNPYAIFAEIIAVLVMLCLCFRRRNGITTLIIRIAYSLLGVQCYSIGIYDK